MSSCKIPHLKFCRFSRQSVTKIMGKAAIWTIFCFSPFLPFNNVLELASSNVTDSQHCIGEEGEFQAHFLKPL